MCILRDLPPAENPRAYYAGGASQFYLYVPMFAWKYFFSMKRERSEEIKRELFVEGEVPVLVHSPSEVWEHP